MGSHVLDLVLAAQEHRLEVDVLHPLPRLETGGALRNAGQVFELAVKIRVIEKDAVEPAFENDNAQLLVSFGGMAIMTALAWLLDRAKKVPALFVDVSEGGIPRAAMESGKA